MKKYGFSKWSWRRASGYSAAKGRLSRQIGIPLTRQGRERKLGRLLMSPFKTSRRKSSSGGGCCGCLGCLGMLVLAMLMCAALSGMS